MSVRYGLQIRAAHAADAPGLAALFEAAGLASGTAALAERLAALQREDGTALLALEWGPPSGLIVMHRFRRLEAEAPAAQVTTLLVGPQERRRGIARLLLKAAARAARQAGCETLTLCATPDQTTLRGFCAATGFSEEATCFVRSLRKRG